MISSFFFIDSYSKSKVSNKKNAPFDDNGLDWKKSPKKFHFTSAMMWAEAGWKCKGPRDESDWFSREEATHRRRQPWRHSHLPSTSTGSCDFKFDWSESGMGACLHCQAGDSGPMGFVWPPKAGFDWSGPSRFGRTDQSECLNSVLHSRLDSRRLTSQVLSSVQIGHCFFFISNRQSTGRDWSSRFWIGRTDQSECLNSVLRVGLVSSNRTRLPTPNRKHWQFGSSCRRFKSWSMPRDLIGGDVSELVESTNQSVWRASYTRDSKHRGVLQVERTQQFK